MWEQRVHGRRRPSEKRTVSRDRGSPQQHPKEEARRTNMLSPHPPFTPSTAEASRQPNPMEARGQGNPRREGHRDQSPGETTGKERGVIWKSERHQPVCSQTVCSQPFCAVDCRATSASLSLQQHQPHFTSAMFLQSKPIWNRLRSSLSVLIQHY